MPLEALAEKLSPSDPVAPYVSSGQDLVNLVIKWAHVTVDFDWVGKEGEVSYPRGLPASDLVDGQGCNDRKITKDDGLRVLCKTLKHLELDCDYCPPEMVLV